MVRRNESKVAVAGGGLTGCLVALDFAERGHRVTLFEKEAHLLSRASTANEGKVHLGYTYAADDSFQTAARLIDDALSFRPLLERWMTSKQFAACLYDTFDYVVPASSDLPRARILQHFARVEAQIGTRLQASGLSYLGETDIPPFAPVPSRSTPQQHCVHTVERGVAPDRLATDCRSRRAHVCAPHARPSAHHRNRAWRQRACVRSPNARRRSGATGR